MRIVNSIKAGIILTLILIGAYLLSPHSAQALVDCPPPNQDFSNDCQTNDPPEPQGTPEIGEFVKCTTGLSSDGDNGFKSKLYLCTFPGNWGQVYKLDWTILQNDNPSPGIEYCVNSSSAWGDGVCGTVQNSEGSPAPCPDCSRNIPTDGFDSLDYTYYSHLVVKLTVHQTFFNENDVQVRWTLHRRQFESLDSSSLLTPSIATGVSPQFAWETTGAVPSRQLFMDGPGGISGFWDQNDGMPVDTGSWSLPIPLDTPGTYIFTLRVAGPARMGGEDVRTWDTSVQVQPAGSPPGSFSLTSSSCFDWPNPKIEVNFSASSGASTYDLQRRTGSGAYGTVQSGTYAQLDNYSDPVSQDTTYEYRLVANNNFGSTTSSNTLSVTSSQANCGGPPPGGGGSAPGVFSLTTSACYNWPNPQTEVNFSPAADAETYYLQRRVGAGAYGTRFSGTYNQVDSYLDDVAQDTTYEYRMQAENGYGTTTSSNTIVIVVNAANCGAPAAPVMDIMAANATVAFGGSTTISWTSQNTTVCDTGPGHPTTTAGNFSTGALTATTTYNGSCTGPGGSANDSVTVTVTTASAGGSLDAGNCDIIGGWAWDPDLPNNSTTIKVFNNGAFYATYPASDFRSDLPGNKNHGFTIPTPAGFKDGNSHQIRVYAVDLTGGPDGELTGSPVTIFCPVASVMSFVITYTPKPLVAPVIPAGTAGIDNATCRKITVNWTYTSNGVEDGFKVYRSTDENTWTNVGGTLGAGVRTYQDTPPLTNVRYYYKVATHRGVNIAPLEVDSNHVNALNLPCVANLTGSFMTITNVNGAAYSSATKIKNGDTLTYRITVVNSGPQNATVLRFCANPSGNLSNLQNFTVSGSGSNNGGVTTLNSQCAADGNSGLRFNVTGIKDVPNNWIITYTNTFTAASVDEPQEVISNSVVIYYSDDEGNKQKTVSSYIISGNTKAQVPTFREVAP